jgi:hypothetical protein
VYVTIAENIGAADCSVPTCGVDWLVTRQPVVLEEWRHANGSAAGSFTGIGAWRGPYAPVEYHGHTYGLRVHEFRKFLALPRQTSLPFQLALDIDDADDRDRARLAENGWALLDSLAVTGDPWRYRELIHSARAEFLVAKGIYVDTNSGWFSERSMCFLASGKPVLAQDTGLAQLYPTDRGLLTFSTLDEAAAGAEEIARNGAVHSAAARAVAEAYFDSDKVLSRLVDRVTSPDHVPESRIPL